MRKIYIIIGLTIFLVIGVAFYEGWRIEKEARAAGAVEVVGPGTYVAVLGFLMLIFNLLFMYPYIFRSQKNDRNQNIFGRKALRPLTVVGMMAGYTALIPLTGFLPGTFVFFLAVFWVISHYSLIRSMGFALAVSLIFFLVFEKIFSLPMPKGFLPF